MARSDLHGWRHEELSAGCVTARMDTRSV